MVFTLPGQFLTVRLEMSGGDLAEYGFVASRSIQLNKFDSNIVIDINERTFNLA